MLDECLRACAGSKVDTDLRTSEVLIECMMFSCKISSPDFKFMLMAS